MSIISKLGGVEKSDIALLESRLNEIEMEAAHWNTVLNRVTELSDKALDHDRKIDILSEGMVKRMEENNLNKTAIRSAQEKIDNLKSRYSKDSLEKRMDDMERLLRYFQNSHGKVLNDIQDLKKELHGLYGRQCPPPPEVLEKSVAKDEKDILLLDIFKGLDAKTNQQSASQLNRCLNANNLKTLADLRKIPYERLGELKRVGPKNLEYLQKMYGEHEARDVKKEPDYAAIDLKTAIREVTSDPREIAYIYNRLVKNGVPNTSALASLSSDFVANACGFGARAKRLLNNIYEKHIWA